jgi:EpsD family peptidyl-prolyl cis-trans isomerase
MISVSALLTVAALWGCANKEPSGQVVALVDGQEVTRRELATEPMESQAEGGKAQPTLLSGVIDRKLASAEARRLELDRTPDVITQRQRLEEVILSRALFARWSAEARTPSPKAISDYISKNPQRFGQRKLFLVDRIQAGAEAFDRQAFEPLASADEVAGYLSSRSQAFQRGQTVIDSASLSPELSARLSTIGKGEPLAIVEGGRLIVLAVVETRDAPVPKSEQAAAATAALTQASVREKLAALRKRATIAYQPGYRPATPAQ